MARGVRRPPSRRVRVAVIVLLTLIAPGLGHLAASKFLRGIIWVMGNVVILAILTQATGNGSAEAGILLVLRVAALVDLWLLGLIGPQRPGDQGPSR
jgi:hypothetical protein